MTHTPQRYFAIVGAAIVSMGNGSTAISFRQEQPGSGSGSGSAGNPPEARKEDNIKVKETPPDKTFLGHCYDLVASVVVLNDGDSNKMENMLGTVCAQAEINADTVLCNSIKASFLKQTANKWEFRNRNRLPLGTRDYGEEQRWNEEEFDAGVFCHSALDLIIANRMQIGPAKPNGVLNTPVDPEVAKAAHERYLKGEVGSGVVGSGSSPDNIVGSEVGSA